MSDYVLGIDLGTSTTAVSVIKDDIPTPIPIDGLDKIMPSVVAFQDRGKTVHVGKKAKEMRYFEQESTIYSIKRVIGRKYSAEDTKQVSEKLPYHLVEGPNDSVAIEIFDRFYSPQDISAILLKYVKKSAEKYLGEKITKAVITVPANYNEPQRRATQNAGRLAGLDVMRIVNEPTAAALAYGFGNSLNEKIAIFDFGGGTFDITILEVKDNFFEVLSTDGDSFLGGDDIDSAIVEFFIYDIETTFGVNLSENKKVLGILMSEAERVKKELSEVESLKLTIKDIVPKSDGTKATYSIDITRKMFEETIKPVVDHTFDICENALKNAHIKPTDVDAVVLVGGSIKVPYVQQRVKEYFEKDPFLGIETELVISMGAAILGQSLVNEYHDESPVLLDVIPLSLGVGTIGDYIEIIVEKNEPLPIERTNVFTNAVDHQTMVKIEIYQGDNTKKSQSHLMGELTLSDLREAKRGELKIQVRFEIDTNGVLNVHAIDMETGKRQKIELNILGLE